MKKKRERINKLIFGACTIVSGAAAMLGINALPVMAEEDVGEKMVVGENMDAGDGAAGKLSENSQAGVSKSGEDKKAETISNEEGIYDFKDNKTTGTFTVTEEWIDNRTNSERPEPEIKISTKKPSKSTLGHTVTFHGNKDAGLVFDDGNDVNDVVYNSNGQIVDGVFKIPAGFSTDTISWFSNKALTNKVNVSEDGIIQMTLTGDVDLWVKTKTFEVKGYITDSSRKNNGFNYLIPETVTKIAFTDVVKPENASAIDVDADGDGGVVAWTENGGTVMKVSTQIKGMKVQAAKDSAYMFRDRTKLTNIDFSMLDAANVTSMYRMFAGCSGLTSLDLTSFNTQNVTDMSDMFGSCSGLTSLDLTSLDTSKVTSMGNMFYGCSVLTSLNLTSFNTANVTNMEYMFYDCSGLTSLSLTSFDTAKVTNMTDMFAECKNLTSLGLTSFDTASVTNMNSMFGRCSNLTSLDLTSFNTAKVTDMESMFADCSGLTSLDLTPLNTAKVTNMNFMFAGCSGLTSLNLTPLNTANVTSMYDMFGRCSGLTSLDLTPLNTVNVMNMKSMFAGCSGLTSLDLTPLNTSKVTNMESMFADCSGLTSLDLTPLNTAKVTNMKYMLAGCSGLTSLDLTPLNTAKVTNMDFMFDGCSGLTSLTTGTSFKFVGTNYYLSGTWRNAAGETFNGNYYGTANFPSNVADTYTKISD